MSQPTISSKLARVLRTLKYPIVLAIIAGVVWYIRSQPVTVASHTVSTGPVIRSVMGTGTLEARIRTTISPKIQGRIAEVLVDQGSLVKAGQLLVRLDDEDLAQQVRMARRVSVLPRQHWIAFVLKLRRLNQLSPRQKRILVERKS